MRVGTRNVFLARAVGVVRLAFNNNCFPSLDNVYYIPGFTRNLISISRLLLSFMKARKEKKDSCFSDFQRAKVKKG